MKLVVIDPHVTIKSPTMRGWVNAFSEFKDLFEEIEIWASECDPRVAEQAKWVPITQRIPTWRLHAIDFQQRVTKAAAKLSRMGTIVQVTGCMLPKADIRYIQYWNRSLLDEQRKRPDTFQLGISQNIAARIAARSESHVLQDPESTAWWWVASRSLAQEIQSQGAHGEFRVIPNQFDTNNFNHQTRFTFREEMRVHYGISSNEKITVFSAFGHFERKGLIQAIQTINILVCKGYPIRILILGGTPKNLESFRKKLKSMMISDHSCIFAGTVTNIQKHLSAGDAFLFPSHFEAFSLAEIEAAALGMRLYLTPHYGSEMILRPPANGQYLPWDPQGMADVIEEDLKSGIFSQMHSELGEAINAGAFQAKLRLMYGEAIQSKANA